MTVVWCYSHVKFSSKQLWKITKIWPILYGWKCRMMVEKISNQLSFDMFCAIIISISTQKIRRSGAFSWKGQIELQIRDRILTLSLVTLSALPVCFLGSSGIGSFWPFTLTHDCHIQTRPLWCIDYASKNSYCTASSLKGRSWVKLV